MNTCSTCKFWIQNDSPYAGELNIAQGHACENPKLNNSDYTSENGEKIFGDKDRLMGLSGVFCDVIFTGPDFGCIHHQLK